MVTKYRFRKCPPRGILMIVRSVISNRLVNLIFMKIEVGKPTDEEIKQAQTWDLEQWHFRICLGIWQARKLFNP